MKASQKDEVSDAAPSRQLRKKFSIRSPLNLSKLADKKALSTTRPDQQAPSLMQTTKYTTTGFFPQLNANRTQSIDRNASKPSVSDRQAALGATQNVFGTTAASMLSDIHKKVTTWDKNAHLDPALT